MLTMLVFTDFSKIFVILCVFCTLTYGRKTNVRFPDDSIVFPNEEIRTSRSENGQESRKFHHEIAEKNKGFQHSPEFHKYDNFPGLEHNESLNEIPLDFIQRLNKYNVSDILLNFVEGEEGIDSEAAVLADRFGSGERNAAVIPKYAGCMPELQTVEIASSRDPNVLYIPQCTRIERCGGCCTHHLLSCQATEVQPVSFTVVKTQYVGASKMRYVGKEIVVVDKHTKCKCDCKIKEEDCNRYQEYRRSECRCVCTNSDEEKKCYKNNQTKLWDPSICGCVCREIKQCSTGYEFDQIDCKCVPSTNRSRYNEAFPRIDDDKYFK